MIEQHWEPTGGAFADTPDPGFIYRSSAFGEGMLAELHRNARRPVLVVDEAQLASPSLLEESRPLTNFEDRQDKHLHVVLLGQPELRERVRKRPQIDQRVSQRFHVEPMEPDDVRGYVGHHLRVAGGDAAFVGAMRALHQIDAELERDVADDQE